MCYLGGAELRGGARIVNDVLWESLPNLTFKFLQGEYIHKLPV